MTANKEIFPRGHEEVVFFSFPDVGLKAIVSLHNTVLGPALGGCRMRAYASEAAALEDVLRLAEGMTYKSSIAGLDLGGGKAVVIADPQMVKGRRELFVQFGECLNRLAGRYISAEDMGTGVADIMAMRERSSFVTGVSPESGGGGDPSPFTARGVFRSIIAACERCFGSPGLAGRSVAIQGVGHVGSDLCAHLVKAGANVVISDVVAERCTELKKKFAVTVAAPETIYDQSCDIYAPCAIGQTVSLDNLKRLSCKIIAGGANNQLAGPEVYAPILERGILYCPDFVVNAGGVINVGAELIPGGYRREWVEKKVDTIYHTIHRILDEAERRKEFPEVTAIALAKERIAEARGQKAQSR